MKIRGSKSLSKSFAVYLYILLKILELLSLPLSCLMQPGNVALLQFCSLACSILFLWTKTMANHHGQQPLWHTWFCATSPVAFDERCCLAETLQRAHGDICYLNDASGLQYSGREIWSRRFLPHWLRRTFPHSLTISLLASTTREVWFSPSAVCHGRGKYCPPVGCRCSKMHHMVSLSDQEVWAYAVLCVSGCSTEC